MIFQDPAIEKTTKYWGEYLGEKAKEKIGKRNISPSVLFTKQKLKPILHK